jgi:PAS domain S-box-containing protein
VREQQALTVDYRVMMESSADSVLLLDIDSGELVHANGKALALFGVKLEALLGTRLLDLAPPIQPDGVASRDLFTRHIQHVLDGSIGAFDAVMHLADGRPINCEVRMIRLAMHEKRLMHVRVVDVTARKLAETLRVGQGRLLEMIARGAPLGETLDHLMLLIESQSEGVLCSVLLLDEDGVTIRPASAPSLPPEYMAALDGYPIGPAVGSCGTAMFRKETVIVSDIMDDPLWEPYRPLVEPHGLRACWSTPIFIGPDRVVGSFAMYYREVRLPTVEDMRLIAVATHLGGIAIDRTRRERELTQHRDHLEGLVAARTEDLTAALDTLSRTQEELVRRDKLAALGALVAGVAHELNTPIGNSLVVATAMADHAQTLAADMADGLRRSRLEDYLTRADEASTILIRNLHRAAALVASFKQLAVDQANAERRVFSVNALLEEAIVPVRVAIGNRPLKVDLALAPGLTMDGFPSSLAQVLAILFDNCLVHAFGADTAGTMAVALTCPEPGQISIAVSDNGIGIAPDAQSRVYDPFFTTRLGSGGSGLGLHVAHTIVTDLLGGRITLRSEPGQGTEFALLLPATAPALPLAV